MPLSPWSPVPSFSSFSARAGLCAVGLSPPGPQGHGLRGFPEGEANHGLGRQMGFCPDSELQMRAWAGCSDLGPPSAATRLSQGRQIGDPPIRPIHISSELPGDLPTLITGAKGLLQQGCDKPLPAGDRRRDRGPERATGVICGPREAPAYYLVQSSGKNSGSKGSRGKRGGEKARSGRGDGSTRHAAHPGLLPTVRWVGSPVGSLSLLLWEPTMSSLGWGP